MSGQLAVVVVVVVVVAGVTQLATYSHSAGGCQDGAAGLP
jgi:hypothetical protein